MCTYTTATLELFGNAKSGQSWERVKTASVYLDHPVAFPATHSLNIDLFADQDDPKRSAALELSPRSAKALAEAILSMIAEAPEGLIDEELAIP
jgi:hypothetical protein